MSIEVMGSGGGLIARSTGANTISSRKIAAVFLTQFQLEYNHVDYG